MISLGNFQFSLTGYFSTISIKVCMAVNTEISNVFCAYWK